MKNEKKKIDALKMKDQIQKEVLKETSGLSPGDEIVFYREAVKEGPFAELFMRLTQKNKPRKKAV